MRPFNPSYGLRFAEPGPHLVDGNRQEEIMIALEDTGRKLSLDKQKELSQLN